MRQLINRYLVAFFLSLVITALGQPDRHPIFALLAYLFGYAMIFRILLEIEDKKPRMLFAFLWAFCVQLFQLNWVATTHYHGQGIIGVYIFLCLLVASQFSLLSLFVQKKRGFLFQSFILASLWTLFEWSRLFLMCGFPFNPSGLVMTFSLYSFQMASIAGIYGLSFWLIFTSSLGSFVFLDREKRPLVLWIICLGIPFLFGILRLQLHEKHIAKSSSISVALVQTGLTTEQKWSYPGKEAHYVSQIEQWRRIFSFLKDGGRESYDLIALPEVALPGDAFDCIALLEDVREMFDISEEITPPMAPETAYLNANGKWFVSNVWLAQALANKYKSGVVAGFVTSDKTQDCSYNSAYHVQPFVHGYHRYDKQVLVPLSEYLPLQMLRSFVAQFGITSFFTPGKESKTLPGKIPLFVSICFEEGFGHIVRRGREGGAKIFVNITNDGWFPSSRLPIEHFNLGRVRAVENGVALLRSCNTGITAAVDPFGRTVAILPEVDYLGTTVSGLLTGKVSCYSTKTIYGFFGEALILSISSIGVILLLIRAGRQKNTDIEIEV